MDSFRDVYLPLVVLLGCVCLIGFFLLMYRWAKKQKGAAMAFGMFVQMFLPDPKAQQTIEMVCEAKEEEREKSGDKQSDKLSKT